MNLLEALEKKRALESLIEDLEDSLSSSANNLEELSNILTDVDKFVDELFRIERAINHHYQETKVTPKDSISDALTHVDALSKKVDILRFLLLEVTRNEIITGNDSKLNKQSILFSINHYESLKNDLLKKVKEICYNTPFQNS